MSHLWLTRPVSSKATATSLVTGAWNPPRAANCSWSSSLGVWHKRLQSPGSFGSPQASTYCCRFFSGVRWSRKSKELWCQFLYCICWKAPDGRKSMNKSLQGLKRAITGAHQWSGLRGTAESSEVTETQEEGGKKGFWDRLLWAEKKEPGLETDLGTPPEAEKMSSTVKRLWDPKNQRKGAVTVMEMSKMTLGIEPITRTAQEKKHTLRSSRAFRVWGTKKENKTAGVTAKTWAPCLCCHLRICRIGSTGSKGKVRGLGFLRPMLVCLLSLVLSLLPFWQELRRTWWMSRHR